MKIEQIKPGHTYYAPVEVVKIANGDVHVVPIHVYQPEELVESPNSYRHVHSECSSPEITNRLKIKRGDRVKVVERFGFMPWAINWDDELEPSEAIWEVDEVDAYGFALITQTGTSYASVFVIFLELVTPVEELEPYYVEDVGNAWVVRKPEPSDMYSTQAWFSKERHPHAKAAAEAERDRLNAEHRKEQQ